MEFKQDDSCSVQKSSCFLEIPFFKLSLTKGTLYPPPLFFIICDALSGRQSKLLSKSVKLQE